MEGRQLFSDLSRQCIPLATGGPESDVMNDNDAFKIHPALCSCVSFHLRPVHTKHLRAFSWLCFGLKRKMSVLMFLFVEKKEFVLFKTLWERFGHGCGRTVGHFHHEEWGNGHTLMWSIMNSSCRSQQGASRCCSQSPSRPFPFQSYQLVPLCWPLTKERSIMQTLAWLTSAQKCKIDAP